MLVFDVAALCLLEAALDATTDAILVAIEEPTVDITRFRAAFWAGLQRRQPCSIAEAEQLMSEAGFDQVRAAVMAGLRGAFGVAEDRDEADPRNRSGAMTGFRSWRLGAKRAVNRIASGFKRRASSALWCGDMANG
ncbi:hypothetical protein HRV97_03140 [Sphingomonas sp. HHU CXW]|uniref:Uncharacterized protein n=1 Tax=Sphingomonas hominis TaxID=2741495 RepID=A0ABX2JFC8_9SPHN|nr:hypothetical protein [Sphingomonas hominis]NTS64156.1 hypothetical protein [Sphingomonas hominis]